MLAVGPHIDSLIAETLSNRNLTFVRLTISVCVLSGTDCEFTALSSCLTKTNVFLSNCVDTQMNAVLITVMLCVCVFVFLRNPGDSG